MGEPNINRAQDNQIQDNLSQDNHAHTNHIQYQSPLAGRYSSKRMQELFSNKTKFETWRQCWIALAEAQYELGLKGQDGKNLISLKQITELKKYATQINYDVALTKEKEIRHDVMSHVYAYGQQCKNSAGIIHLGATSCYVTCNTELILQKKGLKYIKEGLVNVINNLSKFAEETKEIATLGYTHYQPAQPTTIGKRITLYIQDFIMDLESLNFAELIIRGRGCKGTTGTQASYLSLLNNYSDVKKLDELVCKKLGFEDSFPVTGQTYPRKLDSKIIEVLAGIGSSAHKFAVDLRLLSNLKVLEEPFAKNQTGSSAMAYKRNPMRSERICALSRYLFSKPLNFYQTHANQWMERTLDDSAIRRLDTSQSFLCADAVLKLTNNVSSNMIVYPKVAKKLLNAELPFMATEEILMNVVSKGKSRQEMHEIIKKHSILAGQKVKEQGQENDLFSRLSKDADIPIDSNELDDLSKDSSKFIGLCVSQVDDYLNGEVKEVLDAYSNLIGQEDYRLNV